MIMIYLLKLYLENNYVPKKKAVKTKKKTKRMIRKIRNKGRALRRSGRRKLRMLIPILTAFGIRCSNT